jgi:hypothetical protein
MTGIRQKPAIELAEERARNEPITPAAPGAPPSCNHAYRKAAPSRASDNPCRRGAQRPPMTSGNTQRGAPLLGRDDEPVPRPARRDPPRRGTGCATANLVTWPADSAPLSRLWSYCRFPAYLGHTPSSAARCTSPEHAQRFLSPFGPIADHFRPRRHLLPAPTSHHVLQTRFGEWREDTGVAAA